MILEKFEVKIASVPDFDDLIAEIWSDKEFICEVVKEQNGYYIMMADTVDKRLNYTEFCKTLSSVKNKLGIR